MEMDEHDRFSTQSLTDIEHEFAQLPPAVIHGQAGGEQYFPPVSGHRTLFRTYVETHCLKKPNVYKIGSMAETSGHKGCRNKFLERLRVDDVRADRPSADLVQTI